MQHLILFIIIVNSVFLREVLLAMYAYLKNHEAFMKEALKNSTLDLNWLSTYHQTQISFIQHERLIHLLITFFFAFLFLCSTIATLYTPMLLLFLLDLILFITLLFYIRHYYRLENGLERWYRLYTEIEALKSPH